MSESDTITCAETCHECADACMALVPYCLDHCVKQGRPVETEHIQTLLDCAEICSLTHNFLQRGSSRHAVACTACAAICEACAACCDQLGINDEPTRACAEACRTCAASCKSMT